MNNQQFLTITNLQYQNHALKMKLESFEKDAVYQKLEEGKRRICHYFNRKIKRLEKELAKEKKNHCRMIRNLFDVVSDIQDEYEKQLQRQKAAYEKELEQMRKTIFRLENKLNTKINEAVTARAETNEQKEIVQKLEAQLKQDYTNSSIPSSKSMYRGKITNNREKTDRKPGAQPGHEGHKRKMLPATEPDIILGKPQEVLEHPDDYYLEKEPVRKQVIGISVSVKVQNYIAPVYRNKKTGTRVHAEFPENVILDVNYDETVKGLILIMKDHLNLPENKIVEFFREMTNGKLVPSRGFINQINKKFSERTKGEQKEIFEALEKTEVINSDMTGCRVNGILKTIIVCADLLHALFQYRNSKGHAAVKGTPLENFLNTVISDHDKTFYSYGRRHQECMIHIIRYLAGAAETEKDRTWHTKMRNLLKQMDHERNQADGRILAKERIAELTEEYDKILKLAEKEYEDNPPSDYYRKGYNLFKQLRDYKDSCLLFLSDPRVDFTNNRAETLNRKPKRHLVISGTFRGKESHKPDVPDNSKSAEYYCDVLSVLQTASMQGENIWEMVKEVFTRSVKQNEGNRFRPKEERKTDIKLNADQTKENIGKTQPDE